MLKSKKSTIEEGKLILNEICNEINHHDIFAFVSPVSFHSKLHSATIVPRHK